MNLSTRIVRKIERTLDETRLSPLARTVRREHLTYLTPEKFRRLEGALADALKRTRSGDVLEFGVAMGGSAIVLADRARTAGRSFHGFDVFGMIPPPTSDKDDEGSRRRYSTIAAGESEGLGGDLYYGYREDLYGEVCAAFAAHGLPVDNQAIVSLHRGLFQDTLEQYLVGPYPGGAIAFAHIDCDWYDPVKFCLERVAERLAIGGAIVLDDYHDYGGAKAATDEFLSGAPGYEFIDGRNVILVKRGA